MLKSQVFRFLSPLSLLLKRYAWAITLFMLLRLVFVLYNVGQLASTSFIGWLGVLWGSFLYDWIFAWYSLIPVFFLTWYQFHSPNKSLITVGRIWFTGVAFLSSLLAAIDTFYFPFSKIRTGAELLTLTGDNNTSIWTYMADYWWAILIIVFISGIAYYFYPKQYQLKQSKQSLAFLVFIPLGLLLARGGFRLKPLHINDAILFSTDGPWQATLNAGLVFGQTYLDNSNELFPVKTAQAQENKADIQQFNHALQKSNICLIILESFGKEYTQFNGLQRKSYTPYLDSLASAGMYFPSFYANGLKSMDALPAICASIPALLNKPFISTPYANMALDALPNSLKKIGYQSAFFHGADVNSMGFRSFLKKIGIDAYYSKEDMPNAAVHYDGNWGIFDAPFMSFAVDKMSSMKEPFFSGIFTLSSHHPYAIPKDLKNQFEEGTLPIHKSIQYADYALQQFMNKASTTSWYKHTLFIITADHSSQNESSFYNQGAGKYAIPLILFTPNGNLKGEKKVVGQQIDIMPTVLDYVGYPYPFISMGRSLLRDQNKGLAIQQYQGSYHATQNGISIECAQNSLLNVRSTTPNTTYLSGEANALYDMLQTFKQNFQWRIEHNGFHSK